MQGVGPGTVLGGRYTVSRRLQQRDGAERWQGHDDTLMRDVTLLVLPRDHPQAEALLDAARRSAGVDNSHLVRVLDVGTAEGMAYVVEEDLSSAHTLTSIAQGGGVPAEEVRRIVGVASRGLEAARLRGLHHEALSPDSVVRTDIGDVKVLGLATAAALLGREGADAETASRTDAVSVVALAYAGLTGRWPLSTDGAGLPPAPRVVGGVAAPSEIAAGVPSDLDTLCRLTLNHDQGPTTPGDFARQIAPWSHEPVEGVGGGQHSMEQGGGSSSPTKQTDRTIVIPTGTHTPGATSAARAGATGGAAGAPSDSTGSPTASATRSEVGADLGADSAGAAGTGAGASVAAALGGATAAAGSAVGAVTGKVGDFARTASTRAAERRAARAAAAEWTEDHRAGLTDTLESDSVQAPQVEPSVPLVDPSTIEPLDRDESRLALGIVAGLLVIALIIGIWGLSRMGSGVDLGLGSGGDQTTLATQEPTSAAPSASGPTTSGTASAKPLTNLAILSARAFDPQGDNKENDQAVGRVYDGDPATTWTSEGYNTPALGNIKDGVGVILDLGGNAKPKEVVVTQATASGYTVYLSKERALDGATKVGSSTALGPTTLPVPATATGQYLIVWFTTLAPGDGGRYRASLSEVSVKG